MKLVERNRGEEGYDLLELAENVPAEGCRALRRLRDQTSAHLDSHASHAELLAMLRDANHEGMLVDADNVLDHLDAAAPSHVDLGLLVLGHRCLHGLEPAPGPVLPIANQPDDYVPILDMPFGAVVSSGFGSATSARIAGVIAGRDQLPRERWYSRGRD